LIVNYPSRSSPLRGSIHPAVITGAMIILAVLLTLAGDVIWPEAWWLFGVVGLVVGYGLGEYATALLLAVLEWMAQLLVAQGALIAAQRRRSER
jgi:hydrogenase/urease accessory protein HupE